MKRKNFNEIIISIFILIFLTVNLSPLIIALSSSFRKPRNGQSPLLLFREFTTESYMLAISKMNFLMALKNSLIITVTSVVIIVLITSMAGYALARLKNKVGSFMHIFFMAGMIVSAQMSVIPIYMIIKKIGISNSRMAPILLYVTSTIAFSVFLYTNFIKSSVPISLEESALIDGAGLLRIYWEIVFPLIIPATTAVIITQGVFIWNDFFFSMMFLSTPQMKTLPLAMLNFVGDMENATQWNILFAACYLTSIPLIISFSFLQKYFLSGLTVGAVKG
jgi:ABC-type sugar transport system, permease component